MSNKTIFVIDDNDHFRELAVEVLVKNGYQTRECSDGQEALQHLEAGPLPDLIITDVNMPHLSGIMLAKILRDDPKYAYIPLVICSNDEQLCDANPEWRSVYYIDKELSQLISTVDQLTGK